MHDIIQQPRCSKCEQPMAWHSDQEVYTRDGRALVQVFKCETCDRLKARRVVSDESFVAND
jgi:RNase P subunit RPR2